MTCVILAGGKGSRVAAAYPDIAKAMIPVFGKPILQHEIEQFKRNGVEDFILITGYRHETIEAYFRDGSAFGVRIRYCRETEPLGTAGSLFSLDLKEDFILCAGDLLLNVSTEALLKYHREKNALATIFAHPSSHPFDSTLIRTDCDGRVTGFFRTDESTRSFRNLCSAGVYVISPALLREYADTFKGKRCDLDKDLLRAAITGGCVFAYRSPEFVCDIGTPDRIQNAIENPKTLSKISSPAAEKRKAVFVDRDGTVNEYRGYITDMDEIELCDKVGSAVNLLHALGYLVILITNQPVVARGECSVEEVEAINGRVEYLLGKEQAYLDDIFWCPHHPDKGYDGENAAFKIDCSCRKPKPGLIRKAAEIYNIDLSASFMVGDSPTDVACAENAGCVPVWIENERESVKSNCIKVKSLYDFAEKLADNAFSR